MPPARTFCLVARALLAVGLTVAATLAARAQDLSGWWIAVDDVFPTLAKSEALWRMDELLIIGKQGEMESRIFFVPKKYVLPESCVEGTGTCSDAPLATRATFRLDSETRTLQLTDRTAASAHIEFAEIDGFLRNLTVIGTAKWQAEVLPNGNLALRALAPAWVVSSIEDQKINFATVDPEKKAVTRTFARIDPAHLQRLLIAYSELQHPGEIAWRCFLGHATAGEPAFAAIHTKDSRKPDGFDVYAKVESYLAWLDFAFQIVTPDEPDASKIDMGRKLRELRETILFEAFDDVPEPKTRADVKRYLAKLSLIRNHGPDMTDSKKAELLAKLTDGQPVSLAVSEREIAAYHAFIANTAKTDRLMCRK